MTDLAICVRGNDGVGIIVRKDRGQNEPSRSFFNEKDKLIKKIIPSKLKSSCSQECEVKCPSNNLKLAICVFGRSEIRLKVFNAINDEMRKYNIAHHASIPFEHLSDCLSNILQNLKRVGNAEVFIASWSDQIGSEIFYVQSNGESYKCRACALGENSEKIKMQLRELDFENFTTREIIEECVKIVDEIYDESELKITWMSRETNGNHTSFA